MARVLILGATGMLGHKLCQMLPRLGHEASATARGSASALKPYREAFKQVRLIGGIDALDERKLERTISRAAPDVLINCVGIIKQHPAAKDPLLSIGVNSCLPHRLARLCGGLGVRLIHISTDCVFSGRKGNYTEEDVSDAEDLYGRSKFLGEVSGRGCLTLRTSIIGRELGGASGLLEWFLGNRGRTAPGYTRAVYTGFTTLEMARLIDRVIVRHPDLEGVWQVSSEPISKYDLLCLVRDAMRLDIDVTAEAAVRIDRSLNSEKFRNKTGYQPPSWPAMIEELARDAAPYEEWRKAHAS
ncbi:MAG: SDR family oxidoreductase [Myxococcales bacterium]|nr:MAG: SDR family oxidoreductase [Myxococcales bacterium]